MKIKQSILGGLFALGLIATSGGQAQAQEQLSDQSGPISFSATMARYVDIVSGAPGSWDITGAYAGGGFPGTTWTRGNTGVTREIKANTPYRLSILGVDAAGRVSLGGATTSVPATLVCAISDVETPASLSGYTPWNCADSGPTLGTAALPSRWVTLGASVAGADNTNLPAGTYSGTVYLVINAY